jgi:hypothetical protein
LFKVVVKFNEVIIELTPAKCKEKNVKSTAGVSWELYQLRGVQGYPVPPRRPLAPSTDGV